jgi:glycosyltransferase involved in cell wall biosynthesis
VRCWGLAQGLTFHGHEVLISVPRANTQDMPGVPAEAREISHKAGELMPVVRDVNPDVVLTIQWPLACSLEDLHVPLVIDLYGPLLLENLYYSSVHWESLAARKIRSLNLGDFFLCGSQRQLAYFLPWLLQAGVQPDRAPVHIAPLTVPPVAGPPRDRPPGEPHFVAAGIFWPWQNPAPALMTLLAALDELGRGRLTIVGGPHPQWKQGVFPGEAPAWPKELLHHPRVTHRDLLPWNELNELLSTAHVGVDLSLPNTERFLAAPTRVYHYLWQGLPVLLSNYLELAPVITAAGAGWAVDPVDPAAVRGVVLAAVDALEGWAGLSQRAASLVDDWTSHPRPLYEFCAAPTVRSKATSLEQRIVGELVTVYKGLGNAEAELEHLRKDVRDRDQWLSDTNRRLEAAEHSLFEANDQVGILLGQLAGAEDRLAKVRRSIPYRVYRSLQVLVQGPDETRAADRIRPRRGFGRWTLLLRFTIVGIGHLAAQGVRKWKDALGHRTKMLRASAC